MWNQGGKKHQTQRNRAEWFFVGGWGVVGSQMLMKNIRKENISQENVDEKNINS